MKAPHRDSGRLTVPPDEREELFEPMRDALGAMITLAKSEFMIFNHEQGSAIAEAEVTYKKALQA
jgi:hypothetical protein